jgi:hypothetical protein
MINRQVAGIAAAVLALAVAVGRPGAAGNIAAQQPAPVRVPMSVLERYVGEYGHDGNTFKIVLSGDTLFQETTGQRRALAPISETRFHMGGVFTAEFVSGQAGGVTIVMSDGVDVEHRAARKGSRAAPPPPLPVAPGRVPRSVLERYVGTYEFIPGQMSRTDLRVLVRLKGDTLVRTLGADRVLTPISETLFRVGDTSLMVEFVVDEAGVTQVMGSGFQQLLARLTSKR